MSPSSPAATPDTSLELHDDSASNRRKSVRVRSKPALLSQDPYFSHSSNGIKRKRVESRDSGPEDVSDDDLEGGGRSVEESDADEEELREQRRKAKKPALKKSRKSATTILAMRPAVNGVKKSAKTQKSRAKAAVKVNDDETGLFAEVFSHGHTPEAVAADWIARWEQHNSQAMTDLVNFVIRCTGCNLTISVHDIEDPDNAVSKLTDLQDEYQAHKPADYPLISKTKANASFRSVMTGFFETLIQTCHAAGLLYSDLAIIENIEVWVSTMSSSGMRPFRHTATVISLAIGNTLCRVAADVAENTAKTTRQKEGEQKKKSVNKERVKALDTKIIELGRKRAQVEESLKSVFDTVFVHRYRDVDPKIRADCVTALGTWIITLPDYFFEGIYLRYLGWVLSDTFAPTRAEVVKQISKLFKNQENVARLRTFTERFRSRLVEMAMRDSEVSIRASTVELLDLIRKTGLLEPDDIDNIGRLIFDAESRVRKAVTGFFAENIEDLYENTVEELGGKEGLVEMIGEGTEDDYDAPRISWLKLKCVVEALQSYDAEDEEVPSTAPEIRAGLLTANTESRYALAAKTIYDGIPEAKEWEVLAGYLLHDLSTTTTAFEQQCQLSEGEEILLLEILNVSVKSRLAVAIDSETDKRGKKSKARMDASRETQESTALHLARTFPNLLKKFGSNSATVSAVLRMEHILNLEILQELQQDSTAYASLLEDVNKQFLTHADQGVLAEASTALLHARSFDDLEEVTEGKVQELWDNTVNSLRYLMSLEDWMENISEICNSVRRIAHLAGIMDCATMFQAVERPSKKPKKTAANPASVFDLLMNLLHDPALDSEAGEKADETLIDAMRALLFYYMWIVRSLQTPAKATEPQSDNPNYQQFAFTLATLIENRYSTSPVRQKALGTLLELHTLFATFRHHDASTQTLVQHVDPSIEPLILSTFTTLEKAFAKKSHHKLEPGPDDELDSEPEDDDDDDDEDENDTYAQQETLLAEKRLCEVTGKIVLALVARVLDNEGENKGKIKQRITRNRLKLGPNFKEVVAYLDGPKTKGGKRKPVAKKTLTSKGKSKALIPENEEDSDGGGVVLEEGGEEDLRQRELVEDRIVDHDEEEEGDAVAGAREEVDDEMMSD
ncbi:MAG: hypothetical protein Q9164_000041 [Protoblastenia rupestris]